MPVHLCPLIYGSDSYHFVVFGIISPSELDCLPSHNLVLCVVALPITVTPPPTVVVTPPTVPTVSPYLPYYNNVQVIGPKPIYITYNSVVGPSVSNNYGNSKKKPGIKNDNADVGKENPEVLTSDGKVDVVTHFLDSSDDSKRSDILNEAVDFIRNATLVTDQE